jgi:uncharacterized protein DUF6184
MSSNSLALRGFISMSLVAASSSCAHETAQDVEATTRTSALVSDDSAVFQVAKARCSRADECNDLGSGHSFADRGQCIRAYLDPGADAKIVRSCASGVDKGRLDKCLASLANQRCAADLGPVTGMPDCDSYCAPVDLSPLPREVVGSRNP